MVLVGACFGRKSARTQPQAFWAWDQPAIYDQENAKLSITKVK